VTAIRENSELSNSFYCTQAEKMDRRYLLRRDTSGESDQIFGIADTPKEADDRIYKEALKIAKKFKKVYGELGIIKFTNETKRAKNIESKI
jgi:hypothetical protein